MLYIRVCESIREILRMREYGADSLLYGGDAKHELFETNVDLKKEVNCSEEHLI